IHNKICGFHSNVMVDPFRFCPKYRHLAVAVLLCLFDTVDAMHKVVCFFGKLIEMPPKNSAIRTHHRNRSGGVDAKVYSNDSPIMYTCVIKSDFFFKWEIQEPLLAAFLECRGTLPSFFTTPVYVIHVGLSEAYGDPVPGIADIDF